jgi:hypothetical protein
VVVIGLVACCKTKLDHAAPARELYTSPLFRMSTRYAISQCEAVYIASAKHGLVELEHKLAPYDTTVADLSRDERKRWAYLIARELFNRHGVDTLMILGGEAYAEPIRAAWLIRHWLCSVLEPLHGKQIGERLSFLSRALAEVA